jgi:hypothetical protein
LHPALPANLYRSSLTSRHDPRSRRASAQGTYSTGVTMPIEFTPDAELAEELEDGEAYPDTLSGPDGQIHFGGDAQVFLAHWMEKLGFPVDGAAVIFGEGCSLGILHPDTGKVLTPEDIGKLIKSSSKVTRIQ